MDQVKELQIKLGYARETVRLYYPTTSLAMILGMEVPVEKSDFLAFRQRLNEEPTLQGSELGALIFSGNRERMSVMIPPEGSQYVHEQVEASPFLLDLIQLFQEHHHCKLAEIEAVFARHGDYVCEKMPEGTDFDYVMYFEDFSIDEYYYCIKMEMGHTIYHRFMQEDYEALR